MHPALKVIAADTVCAERGPIEEG